MTMGRRIPDPPTGGRSTAFLRRLGKNGIFMLVLTCLFSSGCPDFGDPADPGNGISSDPVSFRSDVQPIFSGRCAIRSCHTTSSPAAGMRLDPSFSYGQIVGVVSTTYPPLKRVVAGEPDSSLLYLKLLPSADTAYFPRMPLSGGPLSPARIETIRRWIAEGALDN